MGKQQKSLKTLKGLTLKDAIKTNRLKDFADQESAKGVPAADKKKLGAALAKAIIPPRSKRQT